jgi:hypothetical protein
LLDRPLADPPISASYIVWYIINISTYVVNISNFSRRTPGNLGITHNTAMTFTGYSRLRSTNDSILAKPAMVLALVRALTLLLLVLGVADHSGGAGT